MTRGLWNQLREAAEINPAEHSWSTSDSRLRSFGYALAGCAHMLHHQKNTRIMTAATLAVVAAGWWIGIDAMQWSILILAIALVWITEFVNAAIEATVNIAAPAFHPMAKIAKDVAAGAVLIASAFAFLIGILILGPPVLVELSVGAG